jgi:hypothetical protein
MKIGGNLNFYLTHVGTNVSEMRIQSKISIVFCLKTMVKVRI